MFSQPVLRWLCLLDTFTPRIGELRLHDPAGDRPPHRVSIVEAAKVLVVLGMQHVV